MLANWHWAMALHTACLALPDFDDVDNFIIMSQPAGVAGLTP